MNRIAWLDPDTLAFPPAASALRNPDGLLAAGGDLSPERLLLAYRSGIFPWFEEGQPILWWSPDPRAVLFPEEARLTRSLRRTLRRGTFEVRIDTAFDDVIDGCSAPRDYTDGTWITAEMKEAYSALHRRGHAHSIESWLDGELVGGLYGVAFGKVFFGESMFHTETDASKVAFAWLCRLMVEQGGRLVDCQVQNDHLLSLGSRSIPREEYLALLEKFGWFAPDPVRWDLVPTCPGPW